MLMKNYDYIRYLTQEMTTYLDTPKQERQKRPPLTSTSLFGQIPMAIQLFFKKKTS